MKHLLKSSVVIIATLLLCVDVAFAFNEDGNNPENNQGLSSFLNITVNDYLQNETETGWEENGDRSGEF